MYSLECWPEEFVIDEIIDYQYLNSLLSNAKTDEELYRLIVDAPFKQYKIQTTFLFLGIIVLLLVDAKNKKVIRRIALSQTDFAERTLDVSVIPFEKIKIRLNDQQNIISAAIREGTMQDTTDWKYLFTPALSPENARINQANAGIAYSAVYPFTAGNGGALIFSFYQYKDLIDDVQKDFMKKYTNFVNEHLSERNAA